MQVQRSRQSCWSGSNDENVQLRVQSDWLGIMVVNVVLGYLCIQGSSFAMLPVFFGNRHFVVYKQLTVFDTLPFLSHTPLPLRGIAPSAPYIRRAHYCSQNTNTQTGLT
jgi:hypothetical protein